MFNLLKAHVSDFNEMHWTSSLRNCIPNMGKFTGRDMDHTDFTFPDKGGKWTRFLMGQGVPGAGSWQSNPPRYHLEVKTTTGGRQSSFHMSDNELQMLTTPSWNLQYVSNRAKILQARSYTIKRGNPRVNDVNILAQVYNAGSKRTTSRLLF